MQLTYPKGWTGSFPLCPLIFSWVYPNFRKFFPAKFLFHLGFILEFPGFSVEWFAFGNKTISVFSGTFPRNFPYHLSPFRKFRNFWSNGKRPCLHRIEIQKNNVLHSLRSALAQSRPRSLHFNFLSNPFVRWESPLLEDLFLE